MKKMAFTNTDKDESTHDIGMKREPMIVLLSCSMLQTLQKDRQDGSAGKNTLATEG